ncbi:MAG: metallophosphoesterase family protein [Thermoplasmata archaeon]|nr:MAG: metallophosphoesterase family protein [Thermoplasmata archaeon]
MRIALISDVHANLPALEAVVADTRNVRAETYICAGDVVGFGPNPKECVDMVRGLCQVIVAGNHDRAMGWNEDANVAPHLAGIARSAEAHARKELFGPDIQWLAGLGHESGLYLSTKELFIVHGSPWDPLYTGIRPDEDPERIRKGFINIDFDFAVLGHTHHQMVLTGVLDHGVIINPGSVGLPLDGDARASWTLLDLHRGRVEPRRVEYDVERTIRSLRYLSGAERDTLSNIYRYGNAL